ncbi:MAG: cobalamin-dependent protein, partial [Mailhella sp.]|nr:cobalamin-dependent protein [Mailhella sp.]
MKILFTTLFDPDDLGSRCLAAYLKQFGHEVRIVALKAYTWNTYSFFPTQEDVEKCTMLWDSGFSKTGYLKSDDIFADEYMLYAEELKVWQPDIIGIGTRTKNLKYFPSFIPLMRETCPNAFIVAGGMGPMLDPEGVLECGVDAVIRGEGEYALLDLVTALEKGENWHNIQNISYKNKEKVIKNALRPQEKDLNAFPV